MEVWVVQSRRQLVLKEWVRSRGERNEAWGEDPQRDNAVTACNMKGGAGVCRDAEV